MKKYIGLACVAAILLLSGCDSKSSNKEGEASVLDKATQAVSETTKNVVDSTKEVATKSIEAVSETTKNVVEATTEAVKDGTQAVSDGTKSVVDSTKEVATKSIEAVSEGAKEAVKKVDEAVVEPTKEAIKDTVQATKDIATQGTAAVAKEANKISEKASDVANQVSGNADVQAGEALFKPCISCHGAKAEKEALGKSHVIAGWEAQKTVDALNGYKNKTYGGAMKTIMYGQAGKLTLEQINQLAAYISTL